MPGPRHHTVPAFLIGRFARQTAKGNLVCQLDKTTGATAQVSPRDATIIKHFYSFEVEGERLPLLEELLGRVENAAAPIISRLCDVGADGLATRAALDLSDRTRLALFVGTSRQRTELWREQTRSIFEQFAAFHTQEGWDREGDSFDVTENDLVEQLGRSGGYSGWVLCMLDWTFVRPGSGEFVLSDTPVSVFDPTPRFPGSGAGVMSSPNAQLFVPLDPRLGLMTRPDPTRLSDIWDAAEAMATVSDAERARVLAEMEGTTAEAIVSARDVADLNLRTYANAQRYLFGSQEAVTETRRTAKATPTVVKKYSPPPPRLHLLEDDPEAAPGVMRALQVFEAPTSLPPRRRRRRTS